MENILLSDIYSYSLGAYYYTTNTENYSFPTYFKISTSNIKSTVQCLQNISLL